MEGRGIVSDTVSRVIKKIEREEEK